MNVDGKSTKSKTLHRRANDLLSTLAQNIDELKNEMKDGKKREKKAGDGGGAVLLLAKHKPNVNLV